MRILISRENSTVIISAFHNTQLVRTATLSGENTSNLDAIRAVAEEVKRLAEIEINKNEEIDKGFRAIEKELSND